MKRNRTPWTESERNELIQWHEKTIAQYPEDIVRNFRRAREKFISTVPIIKDPQGVEKINIQTAIQPTCIICGNPHTNLWRNMPHRYCTPCKAIKKKSKGKITQVFDVLYVSDMIGAAKFKGSRICVHERMPTYNGIVMHIPVLERLPNNNIDRTGAIADVSKLHQICKIMDQFLASREPLLVHCVGGVERSPLIFAYFLTTRGFQSSIENAYAYLKTIRPVVSDRSFWLQSGVATDSLYHYQRSATI